MLACSIRHFYKPSPPWIVISGLSHQCLIILWGSDYKEYILLRRLSIRILIVKPLVRLLVNCIIVFFIPLIKCFCFLLKIEMAMIGVIWAREKDFHISHILPKEYVRETRGRIKILFYFWILKCCIILIFFKNSTPGFCLLCWMSKLHQQCVEKWNHI